MADQIDILIQGRFMEFTKNNLLIVNDVTLGLFYSFVVMFGSMICIRLLWNICGRLYSHLTLISFLYDVSFITRAPEKKSYISANMVVFLIGLSAFLVDTCSGFVSPQIILMKVKCLVVKVKGDSESYVNPGWLGMDPSTAQAYNPFEISKLYKQSKLLDGIETGDYPSVNEMCTDVDILNEYGYYSLPNPLGSIVNVQQTQNTTVSVKKIDSDFIGSYNLVPGDTLPWSMYGVVNLNSTYQIPFSYKLLSNGNNNKSYSTFMVSGSSYSLSYSHTTYQILSSALTLSPGGYSCYTRIGKNGVEFMILKSTLTSFIAIDSYVFSSGGSTFDDVFKYETNWASLDGTCTFSSGILTMNSSYYGNRSVVVDSSVYNFKGTTFLYTTMNSLSKSNSTKNSTSSYVIPISNQCQGDLPLFIEVKQSGELSSNRGYRHFIKYPEITLLIIEFVIIVVLIYYIDHPIQTLLVGLMHSLGPFGDGPNRAVLETRTEYILDTLTSPGSDGSIGKKTEKGDEIKKGRLRLVNVKRVGASTHEIFSPKKKSNNRQHLIMVAKTSNIDINGEYLD